EEKTISTLNYVADGLIRMRMEEDGGRQVTVQRMVKTQHPRDWMDFTIDTGTGIELASTAEVEA
ncbi:MAG: hypothetical protein ABEI97_02415, partial [Candidatus Nanohaloarchaea archaeon]